jgi:hypothetical protein
VKRVALIAVVLALVAAGSVSAAFTKADARRAAAAKLAQFDRNHGWVANRSLERCVKGLRQVRCLGVVRNARKTCRLRIVVLRSTPGRARIKRIACSTQSVGPERIRLRAHLSSTPKRDLQNPFKVTYDYSASATKQVAESGEEPTEPPPGVLALYSDGILECATNVGGGFAAGECPVTYKALGEHRVTSIYTSGDESATVTEVQIIDPLLTESSLSAFYEPLAESETVGVFDWRIGLLILQATINPTASGPPGLICTSGETPACLAPPGADLVKSEAIPVEGRQCGAEGSRNAEPICEVRLAGEPQWKLKAEFETGTHFVRVSQSPLSSGYVSSEAKATVQFNPEVNFPTCDAEHTGPWCS